MNEKIYSSPQDACTAAGVEFPRRGLIPGPWNVTAANDGKTWKQGAGRVRMFADGRGGVAWNWIQGTRSLWFDDADEKLTRAERAALLERAAAERRKWDEERRRRWAEVAAFAVELVKQAAPVVEHPYLTRKHVKPVQGLFTMPAADVQGAFNRFYRLSPRTLMDKKTGRPMAGPVLLVPLYRGAAARALSSIEFISERGGKYALPEAQSKGSFWLPEAVRLSDHPVERMGVAEGLATALSISQVLGFPCAAARSCNNLMSVSTTLRNRYPNARLEVCGDCGPGSKDAADAALAVRGCVRIPSFDTDLMVRFKNLTGGEKPTDWNDFFVAKEVL